MNERGKKDRLSETLFTENELEAIAEVAEESIRAEMDNYKKSLEELPSSLSDMPDENILSILRSRDESRTKTKRRQKLRRITHVATG